jgi:ferredoxin-fold anticodon binding domain-containing protein
MNQEETIEIIEELLKSIKTRGLKKTLFLLKVESNQAIDNPYVINILQNVSDEFNVLVEDMINGRYIRGDYKYAIGFSVYYLYDKMTLGEIHKNVFRNKTKTLLSKYRQMILDLDKSERLNKKYIDIKLKLDKKLESEK